MILQSRMHTLLDQEGRYYQITFDILEQGTDLVLYSHDYQLSATLDKACWAALISGYYNDFRRRVMEKLLQPGPDSTTKKGTTA